MTKFLAGIRRAPGGVLAALGIVLAVSGPIAAESGHGVSAAPKVVVELFTSQGCSSCPPADRLVGELAKRNDVIALSFHVGYWDYIGWKDPFATTDTTNRQRAYRPALGLPYVYTPQMVIGGNRQAVGSRHDEVLREIAAARTVAQVPVSIRHPDQEYAVVTVGDGRPPARTATVWLFAYDSKHTTEVRRGENAGATLTNTNVVRAIRPIGQWNGRKTEFRVPVAMMGIDKQDGCAIIVQEGGNGRILGAADFPLTRQGD